jgi:hypothetical protein
MVGAGVLGLPSTFVPLGWIGGIAMLVFSLGVSWYTYGQLVYMHERPLHRRHSVDRRNSATAAAAAAAAASVTDNAGAAAAAVKPPSASASKAERGGVGHPEDDGSGPVLRFDRYQDLTRHVWGPTAGKWALVPFQTAVLVGLGVTYTVAGGDGLHAIASDYTRAGARAPPAWSMYLAFGALQVLLSQLPDFSSLGWVSAVGAAMSVAYSAIGTGLAAAHKSDVRPSYVPKRGANGWATAVEVFAAISTVLFAYGELECVLLLPCCIALCKCCRALHPSTHHRCQITRKPNQTKTRWPQHCAGDPGHAAAPAGHDQAHDARRAHRVHRHGHPGAALALFGGAVWLCVPLPVCTRATLLFPHTPPHYPPHPHLFKPKHPPSTHHNSTFLSPSPATPPSAPQPAPTSSWPSAPAPRGCATWRARLSSCTSAPPTR